MVLAPGISSIRIPAATDQVSWGELSPLRMEGTSPFEHTEAPHTASDVLPRVPLQRGVEERPPELKLVPTSPGDLSEGVRAGSRLSTTILVLADLTAGAFATLVGGDWVAVVVLVAMVFWRGSGLYERRFTQSILDDAPQLFVGVLGGLGALAVLTPLSVRDGLPVVGAWLAAALAARAVGYAVIARMRRTGMEQFPAVILGSGPAAETLAERIIEHPETGLRLVTPGAAGTDEAVPSSGRLLSRVQHLRPVLRSLPVKDVFVCAHEEILDDLIEELRVWGRTDTAVHTVPELFQFHHLGKSADQVWGIPLETVRRRGQRRFSRLGKRSLDLVAASVALLVLSPLLAAVALAVRLELGRGIIYRQQRVGRDGRVFELYKFRSLPHRQPNGQDRWSMVDESVLGRVGRFIRRYSIDELPQLVNIVKGDMSLVGPRPERPEYVEMFEDEIHGYRHRHRVPAGLTGLAAVRGLRGNSSLTDRVYFDNLYIENWSLWLDLKVLAWTVASVVRGTGS